MGGAPKVVILLLGAAAHHAFMVQLDQMDRGSKLLPDRPTRPHIQASRRLRPTNRDRAPQTPRGVPGLLLLAALLLRPAIQ
jgi:hypothetical protein